jgi:hypothetical protein
MLNGLVPFLSGVIFILKGAFFPVRPSMDMERHLLSAREKVPTTFSKARPLPSHTRPTSTDMENRMCARPPSAFAGECNHLAQKFRIGSLLKEAPKGHSVIGHRVVSFGPVAVQQPQPNEERRDGPPPYRASVGCTLNPDLL